jgi:DNA polymerase III subunit delta
MNLNLQQLNNHLQQGLKNIYLFSGDETLLLQESSDALRTACKQQGFTEREIFDIDTKFDWSDVLQSLNSMSLFADRKLLELRFKTSKIGDDGSKGLVSVLDNMNPDIVILVTMPKIDKTTQGSKWHKAIDNMGVTLQIWPVDRAQLPRWIQGRMQQHGLNASEDALQFLADNVEGNLLAAQQEIEKLHLLANNKTIDLQTMTEMVCNSSRYTVFNLTDRCLAGDITAAMRTLNGLKAEDDTTKHLLPILGFITRELRTLHRLHNAQEQGTSLYQAMQNERIYQARQNLVQNAMKRLNRQKIEKLLMKARLIDQSIKGITKDSPWLHLEQLTLVFAGR